MTQSQTEQKIQPQAQQKPTVRLFGVPFCKWSMEETVAYLTESIQAGQINQVVTANPIIVMYALENPDMMQTLQSAELIVPDGAGAVWAAGHIGHPVKERVAGYDLLLHLLRVGAPLGWKVFLLGAAPDVVSETAKRIENQYPGIQIAGMRDGYFGDEQDEEVINQITEAKPDLLFVARSTSNQDTWIYKYKDRLKVPLMMGVGGSFDVIAGRVKRAPKIFIKLRAEWLFRLLLQPTRYKRMLALPKFAWKVIREKRQLQQENQQNG